MSLIIWTIGLIIFVYTLGFGVSLYRGENKFGGVAVIILAFTAIVSSYLITSLFR